MRDTADPMRRHDAIRDGSRGTYPARAFRRVLALALAAMACGDGGVTDTPKVGSIVLSPPAVSMRAGGTIPLTVEVRDPAGKRIERAGVFWSSSDTGIVVVSPTGVVTARAPGQARVAASALGRSATTSVTVAEREVATVSLQPVALSVRVGATAPLEARTLDAQGERLEGRTITFTTSNAAVATVSSQGIVTGVSPGGATITATSEGRSSSTAVTVLAEPVATVSVSPGSNSLLPGETVPLVAVPRGADGGALTGRAVAWSSSNTNVATVSSTGLLRAIAPGTATITATSEGRSGTTSVTVRPPPVGRVTITPAEPTVTVGATTALTATTADAAGNVLTGRTVTWASGNTAIATVNASGVVTGVSAGTVTITATSEGQSGSVSLRVLPIPVATVAVTPASPIVLTGRTVQLTATARSASGAVLTGRAVSWRSGSPGIATVSASGLVTGVAAGTAVIIAEVEGQTGSTTVTVRVPPVASVTLSPTNPFIAIAGSVQLTATLRDADGNVLTGRQIVWTSSDELTAFVSSNGLVVGFLPGTAIITATSEGVRGTTNVTVR